MYFFKFMQFIVALLAVLLQFLNELELRAEYTLQCVRLDHRPFRQGQD